MLGSVTFGMRSLAAVCWVALGIACSSQSSSHDGAGGAAGEGGTGGQTSGSGGKAGAQGGSGQGGNAQGGGPSGGEGGEDTGGSGPTLQNQLLWLKADAITGLTNGDPVAEWPDSSGNDRDAAQSTPGARPVYVSEEQNSLPVVHFDAASGSFLETQSFKIFETDSSR